MMAKQSWRLVAAMLALLGFVTIARAETEVDPGAVSEGLKAIFKYGAGTRDTADRLNANTVTIMTGTIAGPYVQFGADLASALDSGDQLRVLPIIGRGSVQGVADILFLKGVDLGIVRSDTLDYLEKKGYANNIKKQFTFITKLYNEEMHVLAPKSIRTLADLEGKTVAVDLPNGGTFVTSIIVFERLGIHANFAYIEQRLFNEGGLHKLYYMGPMFRRERPKKGRYRQFYQIGAEVLGSDHPAIDAEVLEMLMLFLERVGIVQFVLLLNSVGCAKCRPEYVKVLRRALEGVKANLCQDCQRRAETNPLRVLDCKVEADQPLIAKLPSILDHLCAECRQHFASVTAGLKARAIPYEITPRLVRGLDYYTRTTFEITSGALGAQNALLGGGRYDGLAEMIGGPPTPGFGFSIGEERLVRNRDRFACNGSGCSLPLRQRLPPQART